MPGDGPQLDLLEQDLRQQALDTNLWPRWPRPKGRLCPRQQARATSDSRCRPALQALIDSPRQARQLNEPLSYLEHKPAV